MSDLKHREEGLFEAALDLDASERANFLRDACGADTALREHLLSLLEANDRAGEFLSKPAPTGRLASALATVRMTSANAALSRPTEQPGDHIGH